MDNLDINTEKKGDPSVTDLDDKPKPVLKAKVTNLNDGKGLPAILRKKFHPI